EDEEGEVKEHSSLASAIRTILIADLVMSLDNVIAVAAAAGGSMTLLILGLAISIPLVIFGSTLLLHLMERYPIIITLGAALLGFVAGEMLVTDPGLMGWFAEHFTMKDGHAMVGAVPLEWIAGVIGAVIVVLLGKAASHRKAAARST
ncbi:MAG: TerC family protein, partial [Burkholderiales bacterium]